VAGAFPLDSACAPRLESTGVAVHRRRSVDKSLLALSLDLSGINDYLFAALRELGWEVQRATVGLPAAWRYGLAAASFRPSRAAWRRQYHARLERELKSRRGLTWRSAASIRLVRDLSPPHGLVMQIGGIAFSPAFGTLPRAYVLFKDYTVALAQRTYPAVLPVRSAAAQAELVAVEAGVCRGAARIFTASENTRGSVIRDYGVPPERVLAVGEGVKCVPLRPLDPHRRPEANTLVFVGKDFERKGGPTLLAAFRAVRERIPGARLLVAGPESRRGDAPGVEWLGLVRERDQVDALLAKGAAFVMPSRCEPFGLVFLEAMAHGLPCIGTTQDAMPEIIGDGETGFLVPPEDPAALAARIVELLSQPDLARSMGERGYARVRDRFQWSQVARRIDAGLLPLVAAPS
jgi:glycosyltransferase involved in cell wall biosynthesis